MIIRENLLRARKAKKMTQEKLAAMAGVPQSLISALETGTRKTTDSLPEIATALGVQPGELDPRYRPGSTATPGPDPVSSLIQVLVFSILRHRAMDTPEIDPAKETPKLAGLLLEALELPLTVTAGVGPDHALRMRLAQIIEQYGHPAN